MSNILEIVRYCGVEVVKVAATKGGEYAGPCPICGGNDRFRVWPEKNKSFCRQCPADDAYRDSIQLLKDCKNMTYKEACDFLQIEIKAYKNQPKTVLRKKKVTDFTARPNIEPEKLWQEKGIAFVKFCYDELMNNPKQLNYLLSRGITKDTAQRFCLGYNPSIQFRSRKSWGLKENGKKLCLGKGIVIPYFVNNQLVRIRTRLDELYNDNRYYILPGSSMAYFNCRSINQLYGNPYMIIESELDAILIEQEAGDIIHVASIGNSSAKPDELTMQDLNKSEYILNAQDADEAGAKVQPWWNEHFKTNRRWPVPEGKDPGEYHQNFKGNLREWIIAGLPIGLKP